MYYSLCKRLLQSRGLETSACSHAPDFISHHREVFGCQGEPLNVPMSRDCYHSASNPEMGSVKDMGSEREEPDLRGRPTAGCWVQRNRFKGRATRYLL